MRLALLLPIVSMPARTRPRMSGSASVLLAFQSVSELPPRPPDTDSVEIAGVAVAKGSLVRLHPGRHADAQDMFLDGKLAVVHGVYLDVEDRHYLAVTPTEAILTVPARAPHTLPSLSNRSRLAQAAPGATVEVRVPPFAAVQCVTGPRHTRGHTRGTPPNVVETDPRTWLELATDRLAWPTALANARIAASGPRADISPWLPLV